MERICDNCMSRVPIGTDKCPKCGIRFENTNPGGALPNGWVLGGRYTVGRYIDIDGEGVTYSAIDANTLQRVHIKEYMPVTLCATRDETGSIIAKPGCEVLFKTTRMDYAELYGILLRMGLVEGLVQVLDVLEENNTAYAVLEKVEGPTLTEFMTRQDEPIDSAKALAILRPVMIGVEAMHSASIVHRGICPDNIILESGGSAKLGGFATLALRQQGSELKPKLYPGYSAPEQYAASEFEGRYTDVYALGAVLYRMLTDEDPVPADERKMQDNLRPARALYKDIPAFLSTAITRAMRITPAERIQNIPDLRLAFTGEGGRTAKGPLGLSKQQLIVGGAALAAIIVLVIIILLVSVFGGGKDEPVSSYSISVPSGDLTVPDFVGMVYADVVKGNSYTDYTFATPTEEYSDDVPEGRIISQFPEAGSSWDGSVPLRFVVSKGQQTEEMPNLVGKKRNEAIAALTALGVQYSEETVSNTGDEEAGVVVRTDPAAGTQLTASSRVTLYISEEPEEARMPNLNGLSEGDVRSQMREAGINYTTSTKSNDGRGVPGTVAETSISAGQTVDLSRDTVTVTFWSDVSMPNVTGMTLAQAQQALNALRNTPSGINVNISAASGDANGTIVSTDRDGGTIRSGDTVNAAMTSPAPTPDPTPEPPAPPTPEGG
ncbi:PASTA domain-containing protein [Ruminococcaceae bacterium OttesenSCG-928-I18]|nr:PASTA domain-containing protein [Ruminococcaceae bacterium OttesenSCG-928-I18]